MLIVHWTLFRLAAELFIYSAGLFPLLANAALTVSSVIIGYQDVIFTSFCLQVRSALLTVYETHFVPLGSRLRPGDDQDSILLNSCWCYKAIIRSEWISVRASAGSWRRKRPLWKNQPTAWGCCWGGWDWDLLFCCLGMCCNQCNHQTASYHICPGSLLKKGQNWTRPWCPSAWIRPWCHVSSPLPCSQRLQCSCSKSSSRPPAGWVPCAPAPVCQARHGWSSHFSAGHSSKERHVPK